MKNLYNTAIGSLLAGFVFSGCLMTTTVNKEARYGNHFDGERFYNVPDRDHPGIGDGIKWLFSRDAGPWDEPRSDFEPGPPPPAEVGVGEARVTFVNHATVLIQIDGLNILTDPIYAERASPVSWTGPRRVRPPGIRFQDLPKIHAVLVSHDHYDHMCLETLKNLYDRDQPVIYTGLRNGKLLEDVEIGRVKELDWWQSESIARGVKVTFVPAQHFSGRGTFDRFSTLWGGFVIAGKGSRIYFAGDTGEGPHFNEIRQRLGPLDLALLPIGAYRPRDIMGPIHLSPRDAIAAHQQLGARFSMAIHFGTFPLADDGQREPLELLDRALNEASLSRDDFWVLDFGEGRNLPSRESGSI
jgi:L-ascorbate metabolism protein UlaG (beta-lactamase superfamily)